ncbi:hypothetical protein DRO02_05135 [archaeon]|nr:MAG: hypothetical protein DRO02_05135 [archaeon]
MAMVEATAPAPTEKKATAGFVISLIAGILIIIHGLAYFVAGSMLVATPVGFAYSGIIYLIGGVCLLFGILVIIGAWLMYAGKTTPGGILVLLFGILSLFLGGGFFIGFILAIIGGALGLAGK